MSLPEIPFRAREQWRRRHDRALRAPDLPVHVRDLPVPRWPVDVARLRGGVSERDRERLAADVRGLLNEGFELLGAWRSPRSRTDWTLDPESGAHWPAERFCFDIDFRLAPRDVKPAWELNRLQHLQVLALGAAVLEDAEAREACIADLRCWLADNPPFHGIGYASGVEVACRIVSLLVVGALVELPAEVARSTWRALHAHGVWLARYPSLYSSANNHRIAELGALACLGALAPELPEAEAWLHEGVDGLVDEIDRQIGTDGVGTEHAPAYQAWTMEWYLVARHAVRSRVELGPEVDRRLAAGADFLASLLDERGGAPDLGDDDGTVVLRQTLAPDAKLLSIAGATAGVLDRPGICPSAWTPDLRSALLGVHAAPSERYHPRSRTFSSGYTVLEVAGRKLVFDHAPLGFVSLAAHGHADALAIWLHAHGRPVLVDAGTWRYHGPPWRAYFRGTSAHNTITVDDCDQSEQSGPFTWWTRAEAGLIGVDLAAGRVQAEHYGYRERLGVVHRRTVELDADRLVVDDVLEGEGVHRISVVFTFAPDLEVTEGLVVRDGDRELLVVEPPRGLSARVARQAELPAPGLVSESYGKRRSAPTVVFEGELELPASFRTVLRFG